MCCIEFRIDNSISYQTFNSKFSTMCVFLVCISKMQNKFKLATVNIFLPSPLQPDSENNFDMSVACVNIVEKCNMS